MAEHDITVSETIRAEPGWVWRVLTEPELVARWMAGAEVTTTWAPGAPIVWRGEYDGRSYEDEGEIVAVEPARRLAYTQYGRCADGAETSGEHHRIEWTLQPGDGGTTELSLSETGASAAEEAAQLLAGWRLVLDRLREVAEG